MAIDFDDVKVSEDVAGEDDAGQRLG